MINININKEKFLLSLQKIIGVYEKNNTQPSSSNVLIKAQSNQLKLVCTNLEIEINTVTQSNSISQDVTFSVSINKIYNIFRLLPDKEIFLNYKPEENLLLIKGKTSSFSLKTLSVSLFPVFSTPEKQYSLTINYADFVSLIKKTSICIANKDFRIFLNGLLLHVKQSELIAVSSDSHRLGFAKKNIDANFEKKVIIPRRSIIEILKISQLEESTEITINFYPLFLSVEFKNTILKTKLISAEFPNYANLIPKEKKIELIVDRIQVQQAVKTISAVLEDKKNTLILEIYENVLIIKNHQISSDEEKSEIRISLEKTYPNFKIAFNAQYLFDVLREITGDQVVFKLTKPTESCLICSLENNFYQYIIMPMNI